MTLKYFLSFESKNNFITQTTTSSLLRKKNIRLILSVLPVKVQINFSNKSLVNIIISNQRLIKVNFVAEQLLRKFFKANLLFRIFLLTNDLFLSETLFKFILFLLPTDQKLRNLIVIFKE